MGLIINENLNLRQNLLQGEMKKFKMCFIL